MSDPELRQWEAMAPRGELIEALHSADERIEELEARLEAVKNCPRYERHMQPIKKLCGLYMLAEEVLAALEK